MTIEHEKEFVDFKLLTEAICDFTLHGLCDSSEEVEFYSTYGATKNALWERCYNSFDSWDKFMDYCNDVYNNHLQMLQLNKALQEIKKNDNNE